MIGDKSNLYVKISAAQRRSIFCANSSHQKPSKPNQPQTAPSVLEPHMVWLLKTKDEHVELVLIHKKIGGNIRKNKLH